MMSVLDAPALGPTEFRCDQCADRHSHPGANCKSMTCDCGNDLLSQIAAMGPEDRPDDPYDLAMIGAAEGRRVFRSEFGLEQRVIIDGCESTVAVVTAVSFRIENPQIEVSWWSNGALQSAWVSPWRLSPAPERPNRDR